MGRLGVLVRVCVLALLVADPVLGSVGEGRKAYAQMQEIDRMITTVHHKALGRLALGFLRGAPASAVLGNNNAAARDRVWDEMGKRAFRSSPRARGRALDPQLLLQGAEVLTDDNIVPSAMCGVLNTGLAFGFLFSLTFFVVKIRWYLRQYVREEAMARTGFRSEIFWGLSSVVLSAFWAMTTGVCFQGTMAHRVSLAMQWMTLPCSLLIVVGAVQNRIQAIQEQFPESDGLSALASSSFDDFESPANDSAREREAYHFAMPMQHVGDDRQARLSARDNRGGIERHEAGFTPVNADAEDQTNEQLRALSENNEELHTLNSTPRDVVSRVILDASLSPLSHVGVYLLVVCSAMAINAGVIDDKSDGWSCDYGQVRGHLSLTGQQGCTDVACPQGAIEVYTLERRDCLCLEGTAGVLKFKSPSWSGGCSECEVGKFANELGMAECTTCRPGTSTFVEGATECTECEPGFWSYGVLGCQLSPCESDLHVNVAGVCQCKPGYYGADLLTQDRSTGLFPDGLGCTQCDPGKVSGPANGVDTQTCHNDCPAGSYLKTTRGCEPCTEGVSWSVAGLQTDCTPCHLCHRTSEKETQACTVTQQRACQCKAGYAGSPSTLSSPSSCDVCDDGFEAPNDNMGACTKCAVGKYRTKSMGSELCKDCPQGTEATTVGASACTPCAKGKYVTSSTGLGACAVCDVGTYSNAKGSASCTQCEEGKYQDDTGQTACKGCPVGTYAFSGGSSDCEACPQGYYNNKTGQKSCTECPSGWYSDATTSTACKGCAVGHYAATSASTACEACPSGWYADVANTAQCNRCEDCTGSAQTPECTSQCP